MKNALLKNADEILILIAVASGALLRFADISIPDLSTDEAQFALGASAAQPPVGMAIFRAAQMIFGQEIIVVRGVSILLGLLTLPLIYGISREVTSKRTAAMTLAVAAIFPSHIYFSRLAYLSVPLFFAWALVLYTFLKARKGQDSSKRAPRSSAQQSGVGWLTALYLASVFATFIKTQGLLLPMFLAVGSFIEAHRKSGENFQFSIFSFQSISKYQLSIVLLLSLIPISFYLVTQPKIAATLLLYGGNMYGLSGIVDRLIMLLSAWISMLGIFLAAAFLSVPKLKTLPWPVLCLIAIGAGIGLVLGPGHTYYTAHLLLLSIPIAIAIVKLKPLMQHLCLGTLLLYTLTVLGPYGISPAPAPLFAEEGPWNIHAESINDVLKNEDMVTVLGDPGHHVRWYLKPHVLVGKNMAPPYPTPYVLLLGLDQVSQVSGTVEYAEGSTAVVRQNGR